MIGIIDYGLGNLASVAGAVHKLGFDPVISAQPDVLRTCRRLILPGVGAFGDGMNNLRQRGLVEALGRLVLDEGKPLLGICLGAQLVARESAEFGRHQGLGWIDATVERLQPADRLRVPHVGWNQLHQVAESPLFADLPDGALFYFVHSFRLVAADPAVVIGECDYGGRFPAVIHWKNVWATQFHPEKSQRHGLQLLRNFLHD